MEKHTLERIQELLLDAIANIVAIKQVLVKEGIADPQTLQDLSLGIRMKISDLPESERLRTAAHSLVFEKDIR